ncbi:MAG: ABC transporter ATP-binding protein [Candidatus Peribacteraceae bacterium]|nr:ABC transporter ATP-binding protein [Candidatus Peribacteraceae bacterium]
MSATPNTTIGKTFLLLRKIHIRPIHIIIPIVLAILAACFEGVGMGLLIPILNGFLGKSFAFTTEIPYIGPVMRLLPQSVLENDRLIFGVLLTGFIGIYILRNLMRFLSAISMAYLSQRTLHHLRKTLFSRYLSFGKQFFDTTNIGHHSLLLLDFSQNALLPLSTSDRFINALFTLIVYFGVMLTISWKLTLIALPLFAVLHFAVRSMIVAIKHLSYSIIQRGSDLNKKSVEILSTIPLVKSYRTERLEQGRYTTISDEKARLDFRVNVLQSMMLPLQEIITVLVAAGIFMGSLYLFGRDQIASAPALVVYFYVVINASSKFGMVSSYRGALANSVGPLDAVLSIFDDKEKFFVAGGPETFPGLSDKIECRHLDFSYSDREILKDVSFSIKKGRMTAIVGPTGAGKSTLINLLMRFYDCPGGSIFIDGKDIRTFTLDSYLAHTAVVSQETLLLHDSLRNNILYGLSGVSEQTLLDVVRRARLADFIAELPQGLETLIGDRGVKLSGGEKQRVSIARALLKGAEILILDEATSSLDSRTEKLIQEAIDEAVADRTAIVIAHRLSTIRHADKIIVLQEGRLAEEGTLDELLARKGVFSMLWEEQKF